MARKNGSIGSLDLWDALIGELYESVLNPAGLRDALKKIDHWMGSNFCHFLMWDNKNNLEKFSIYTDEAFSGAINKYREYYGFIDPRRPIMQSRPIGTITACHDHFDDKFVDGSEFYQELLLPYGFRRVLASKLLEEDGLSAIIAFNHMNGQGHFTDAQRTAISRLVPHMQRAVRLSIHSEKFRGGLLGGATSLDALDQAVFTLNSNDRVIFMNSKAQELLRSDSWLKTQGGQLATSSIQESEKFRSALARSKLSRQPESFALYGKNSLAGEPTSTQLVTVLPLLPGGTPISAMSNEHSDAALGSAYLYEQSTFMSLRGGELVVLVSPQRRKSAVSAGSLKALFGLTPAEARLAHELAKGTTVDDYADSAAISIATARTQLRSILAKTGEARLQDLVRMLSTLPSRG